MMTQKMRTGFSLTWFAEHFDMARSTVSLKIKDAGILPVGTDRGNPVYAVADVSPLLDRTAVFKGGELDVDQLSPNDRRAWFQSENERIKLEKEQRLLVPAEEVRKEMAALIKPIVQVLDSLPDVLERDCGLPRDVLTKVQDTVDGQREHLYQALTDE